MRTPTTIKAIVTTFVVAICFVLTAQTSFAQWPTPTYGNNQWSVEFGGKIFDRPTDDLGLPLVTNSVTNEVLLNSDQAVDLDSAAGVEGRLNFVGKRLGVRWEVRTFLANFDTAQRVEGTDLDAVLFPTLDPNAIEMRYDSEIFNLELNAKRDVLPGVTLLCGPRFIHLREQFVSEFEQTFGLIDVVGNNTIVTRNQLYGYQVGFELNSPIGQRAYIHSFVKAGGYLNPTKLDSTTQDNFNGQTAESFAEKSTGSFVGEVGGKLYFEIVPNTVSSYVGWEGTWIDGVALAPAQFLTTGPDADTVVVTGDTPFFHAISFGLKFNY